MWRPKDWRIQYKIESDWDNAPTSLKWEIPHSHGYSDGYEAGADAMLEALLTKGLRINNIGDFPQGIGTVIFIPDEEEDG